ncbi:PAS domain-containing protein [Mycolicibacterium phocaicum]|uniref:PAS domain-containing protein n=2 Tax=Mycolicibacterium TaxID=1866885 RepID=A0AA94UFJ9_9MYCO|nr:PAS domain-containing protein [Mycolicibacterium mucogenicum]TLH62913.1 PAS domain-containing protein [Mycolicibacterium phocaicum]
MHNNHATGHDSGTSWNVSVGASAASFRSLSETSPYAVLVHDRGRVVYANAAAASLTMAESTGQMVGAHHRLCASRSNFERLDRSRRLRPGIGTSDVGFAALRWNHARHRSHHGSHPVGRSPRPSDGAASGDHANSVAQQYN